MCTDILSDMPEQVTQDSDVLGRWKRNKWIGYLIAIAAVMAGIAAFTDSAAKIYNNVSSWVGHDPAVRTVALPFDSGWVFAGYYDQSLAKFVDGPYVEVAKTNYPDKQTLPRRGDQVRTTAERNIIIQHFASTGLAEQMNAPMSDLQHGDYTGVKLPIGTTMVVRDIGGGAYPDRPSAVWLRVGAIAK